MAEESYSVTAYNTVNPARVPMDRGLHLTEIDTCISSFYKGYTGGMKFRVVSGVVISPTSMAKFLRSFGL